MNEPQAHPIQNVAIIMDGNGRWAKRRGRPRVWGHVRGAGVISEIVEEATDLGLKSLTLYAFSSENWARPSAEVRVLFSLLKKFLKKERARIMANKVRFRVIGAIEDLPNESKKLVNELVEDTRDHDGLQLVFAFSYGARSEILRAVNRFIIRNPGELINEENFNGCLDYPPISEIDLLIRTGGDQRISNFLLWQLAYSEFHFTQTQWPDFTRDEFREILNQVANRERRFGGILGDHKSYSQAKEKAVENRAHFIGQ